jgi:hypothetical protein
MMDDYLVLSADVSRSDNSSSSCFDDRITQCVLGTDLKAL